MEKDLKKDIRRGESEEIKSSDKGIKKENPENKEEQNTESKAENSSSEKKTYDLQEEDLQKKAEKLHDPSDEEVIDDSDISKTEDHTDKEIIAESQKDTKNKEAESEDVDKAAAQKQEVHNLRQDDLEKKAENLNAPEKKDTISDNDIKTEEAEEEIRDARAEIDRILDKINRVGYDQLDEDEKELLFRASRDLSDDENKRN